VGYLTWDETRQQAILELDESYQNSPIDLAPLTIDKRLPIHYARDPQQVFHGLPPLLADSLPDHFGNRVFQEWLIKNNYAISDLNPVDRLMYVSARGMGALTYEPAREVPNTIEHIDFSALARVSEKIIQGKYDYTDFLANEQALQHILRIGSSVGGAQAKVLVAIHDKSNELRAGDILHDDPDYRYYIVKLAHDTGTPWGQEKILVEYVYHLMAREAGIKTCNMQLHRDGDARHLMIERFDREQGQRIHMQTLMALSGRYDRRVPFSYEDCFRLMTALRMAHEDIRRLYRQMVFNVFAHNMDDHSKNISFLMDDKGQWRLSPAYDLTYPFDPYLPSLKAHKMSVNGKVKDINTDDLLAVAKKVGIRAATRLIEEVKKGVTTFKGLAKDHGVSIQTIDMMMSDS
jgi:serine/threonine-protein kinase HipA